MMRGKSEAATVAATTAEPVQRVEIVSDRRRRHDVGFRAAVVAESLKSGARVRDLAKRHGICPSLIYRWRRLAMQGASSRAAAFLPVRIVEAASTAPLSIAAPREPGKIEIELAGGIRIRVEETVNLPALRRVLSALRG